MHEDDGKVFLFHAFYESIKLFHLLNMLLLIYKMLITQGVSSIISKVMQSTNVGTLSCAMLYFYRYPIYWLSVAFNYYKEVPFSHPFDLEPILPLLFFFPLNHILFWVAFLQY